jgi:hypothetical protein
MAGDNHLQFHAQHRQHGQQFSGAELGGAAAFEARKGFGREAGHFCHRHLPQSQGMAARSDGFAELV